MRCGPQVGATVDSVRLAAVSASRSIRPAAWSVRLSRTRRVKATLNRSAGALKRLDSWKAEEAPDFTSRRRWTTGSRQSPVSIGDESPSMPLSLEPRKRPNHENPMKLGCFTNCRSEPPLQRCGPCDGYRREWLGRSTPCQFQFRRGAERLNRWVRPFPPVPGHA